MTTLPTVLHTPSTKWHMQPVRDTHIDALRVELWARRTATRCRQLIKRINDAEERERGLGIIVREKDDESLPILAYGQVMLWTRCAEISDLVVMKAHRNRGIGTAMCKYLTRHLLDSAKADCVEIGAAKSNPRALSLYRRLGFKEAYTLNLKLDNKKVEPVVYLRLFFDDYATLDTDDK